MIVGFDDDDASIFDERLRFIRGAVRYMGAAQRHPRAPLHARRVGRLIADSVGISSCSRTSCRAACPARPLRRLSRPVNRLYDYRHYRRRAMALILNRGPLVGTRVLARRDDLAVLARIAWHCVLRASPRRAWLVWSCVETALAPSPRDRDASPLWRSCTSTSTNTVGTRHASSRPSSVTFGIRARGARADVGAYADALIASRGAWQQRAWDGRTRSSAAVLGFMISSKRKPARRAVPSLGPAQDLVVL